MPYALMKSLTYRKTLLGMPWCKGEDTTKIRNFLEKLYPNDKALEYKEGELRGGISIIIPFENLDLE